MCPQDNVKPGRKRRPAKTRPQAKESTPRKGRLIRYVEKNGFVTQLKESQKAISKWLQGDDLIVAGLPLTVDVSDRRSSSGALIKLQNQLRTTQITYWLIGIFQRLDLYRYFILYDRATLSVQESLEKHRLADDEFLRWTGKRLRDLKQRPRIRRGRGICGASIVKTRLAQLHLAELGDPHMKKTEMIKHVTWCRNQGQFWSELVRHFGEEIVCLGLKIPLSKIPNAIARENLIEQLHKRAPEFADALAVARSFLEDVHRRCAKTPDRR